LLWKQSISDLMGDCKKEDVVIHIEYQDRGGKIYTNNHFLVKQGAMNYDRVKIAHRLTPVSGGYELTVSAKQFARGVFISLDGKDDFISDNFFDLLPNHEATVKITTSLPLSEVEANLTILSFADAYSHAAPVTYIDAATFPLLGKATDSTTNRYTRLPDSLLTVSRPPLWGLGQNSAGLALRFRSNSTRINARWEVTNNSHLNNIADIGVKGLDLYCLEDDQWVFMSNGKPSGKKTEATIIANMTAEEREYMLYLPLYDGIVSLEIGVDPQAFIRPSTMNSPVREKPVVCYGTSILQGGSASRPGMAHTNILSRWLNREFINLGFSGNGKLDLEIADVIAAVDASYIILDFVPNATVADMNEKADAFYRIIRAKHPTTPILLVEDPHFIHSRWDAVMAKEIQDKNETLHRFFDLWKAKGDQNIELLSSKDMLGDDGEATIDGIHFTDVGFMRYAQLLYPVLKAKLH
jgi:hypothetical protein